MYVTASRRNLRCSARKARLVIDQIRGRSVGESVAILRHSPKAVAKHVAALLKSAVANAEENHDYRGDFELIVDTAFVDMGMTWKRIRPKFMGMASRVRKRTCHITIALSDGKLESMEAGDNE